MLRAYLHMHHDVLWEWATEPIENRIDYIKERKPEHERPTRLRLLKEIPLDRMPPELVAAWGGYEAAWEKRDAAWKEYLAAWKEYLAARKEYVAAGEKRVAAGEKRVAAWEKCDAAWEKREAAWGEYEAAREKYAPQMEALHRELCPDCPWDGHTIFPEEVK